MAFYRCGTVGSGSRPAPVPENGISLILNADVSSSSSTTYHVTENGLYLLIASYSYSGSCSITIPTERVSIIEQNLDFNNDGMSIIITELKRNDQVTLYSSASSWVAHSRTIFKLDNVQVLSTIYSNGVRDGWLETTKEDTGNFTNALWIGLSNGRTQNNIEDDSTYNEGALWHGKLNINTLIRLNYTSYKNAPTFNMYGYDGGFAGFIAVGIIKKSEPKKYNNYEVSTLTNIPIKALVGTVGKIIEEEGE